MSKEDGRGRQLECTYASRVRALNRTAKRPAGPTPWTDFLSRGVGSTVLTTISRASVYSTLSAYGAKNGKRYVCSVVEKEAGVLLVTLREIHDRD